ncbi:MAG: DUF1501 domain-containing protein [Pirellulaceae bacterium]
MKMYGLDRIGATYPDQINPAEEAEYFGRKCLIARRLLERGVRFVQIWSGNDNGFPRATGTRMRTSGAAIMVHWARGMAWYSSLAERLKATWAAGRYDRVVDDRVRTNCRALKVELAATTIHMSSPIGYAAAVSERGATYGESDDWGYKPLERNNPTQVVRHPRDDLAFAWH